MARTLMSRLINSEPCVKMAVRIFLPYVRLINEGHCLKGLLLYPPIFYLINLSGQHLEASDEVTDGQKMYIKLGQQNQFRLTKHREKKLPTVKLDIRKQ